MPSQKINLDITVYGSKQEVESAVSLLKDFESTDEQYDRIRLMHLQDMGVLKATILYRGNYVWNQKKLLANFRTIVKSNDMNKMTKYTYNFLHLTCGSIAHYDQRGWIRSYPTVNDLRSFFRKNEYGQSVLQHQPRWKADAIVIVHEINKILGVKVAIRY
jgi:hypothetical protein